MIDDFTGLPTLPEGYIWRVADVYSAENPKRQANGKTIWVEESNVMLENSWDFEKERAKPALCIVTETKSQKTRLVYGMFRDKKEEYELTTIKLQGFEFLKTLDKDGIRKAAPGALKKMEAMRAYQLEQAADEAEKERITREKEAFFSELGGNYPPKSAKD